jgi:putative aldouronate transport system permease protein
MKRMTTHVNGSTTKEISPVTAVSNPSSSRLNATWRALWRQRWLYLIMAPTLIYFVIFKYIPLWNAQIAFKDFKPLLGVWGSPWVGFEHFQTFIDSFYFNQLMVNTIFFSTAKLLLGLPVAIILALALHETLLTRFRVFVQTAVYLPTFYPGSSCLASCSCSSPPTTV